MSALTKYSYQDAQILKKETIWRKLSDIKVFDMIKLWAKGFKPNTASNYTYAFSSLHKQGVINLEIDLQQFALINHNAVLKKIREMQSSEATIQARAAAYISFTKYLHGLSEGIIPAAIASKHGADRIFKPIREKVKSKIFTKEDLTRLMKFFLDKGHIRNWLICVMMMQGAKRITEVLNLDACDIEWENNTIRFLQSKTSIEKYTYIHFPVYVMTFLKSYLDGRTIGPVFLTKEHGKGLLENRYTYRAFLAFLQRTGKKLNMHITTHMFRASCITFLRSIGTPDHEIMKITGHTTPRMINHYDKNSLKNNVTIGQDITDTYQTKGIYDDRPYNRETSTKLGQYFTPLEEEIQDVQEVS